MFTSIHCNYNRVAVCHCVYITGLCNQVLLLKLFMSVHVSVIRYNANIVPQDIQDLISYPDLLLTKLCQQIFFKCFFFFCRYLLLIGCTLNGMRSNYVAKCSPTRTRRQKISRYAKTKKWLNYKNLQKYQRRSGVAQKTYFIYVSR